MTPPFDRVSRALLAGLDLLVVGLVALAVAVATHSGTSPWLMSLVGAAFLAVYGVGRVTIPTTSAPLDSSRARLWPELTWIVSLVALWVALLVAAPVAMWVAFPLMLLALHALGPRLGVPAVVGITLTAIGFGLREGELGWSSMGTIIGPAVGAGLAVAIVFGLEALVREVRQRQALLTQLTATRSQLVELERERAVMGERERLAREIHDTLAQGFSAINLLLKAATPAVSDPRAVTLIDQASETARDNLAEARRFVRALAPVDLGGTLVAALRRVCDRAETQQAGLIVRLDVVGDPHPLAVAVEAALLRITQSALANVTQHASAATATVAVSFGQGVSLRISDDGVGFDATRPASSGFGLRGIASRVSELGGEFDIRSAPAGGTCLSVQFPLDDRSIQ